MVLVLFDSKLLYDKQPLIWIEQDEPASVYSSINKTISLSVSSSNTRNIRQTYRRFISQSMTVLLNGIIGQGQLGLFDDMNGYFFTHNIAFVKRKNGVDTIIPKNQWTNNRFEYDFSKPTVFYFNFEWMTSSVYCGIIIGTKYIELHQFVDTQFLFSSLPIRYEITTTGSMVCGGATILSNNHPTHQNTFSIDRSINGLNLTDESHLTTQTNNMYPLLTFQLSNITTVYIQTFQIICSVPDSLFRWGFYIINNPIPITETIHCIQYNNTTTNTDFITNGKLLISGYAIGTIHKEVRLEPIGFDITNTSQTICLIIQPITHPTGIHGNQTVIEHIYYGNISLYESI
jgi:hypothetical protein